MPHVKVWRRSITLEEWAYVELKRIEELVVGHRIPVMGWEVREGWYHPEGYTWENDFRPVAAGDFWGMPDGGAQFRGTIVIPSELDNKRVWFSMRIPAEVIVRRNGRYLDGIDPNRPRILLADPARATDHHEIIMDAYVRSRPDDARNPAVKEIRGCVQKFPQPFLMTIDEEVLAARYDFELLLEAAYSPRSPAEVQEFLQAKVREIVKLFPEAEAGKEAVRASLPAIRAFCAQHVYSGKSPYAPQGRLAAVAHSHLDIGYLWKAEQTVQKNARTCLIQLRLMDRFPQFLYAHSQAWCYETLEKHYPEIFAEVKQRVAQGRWEIVGAQYVEPDGNVPSAESHIRQLVYGKRYFLEKFGVEVDNCWLPDNFGNSAILPQILTLAGVRYFVSNKMSTWNDVNRFPYHAFMWRGIDGTSIRASIPPMHFISWNTVEQLRRSWTEFSAKELCEESMHMYGYGDGGSGVTDEMIAWLDRLSRTPGFPSVRLSTAKEYLDSSFAKAETRLPEWDGELYLEMHRGTFTTKGILKRENRHCELQALETEALCAMASIFGEAYPHEKLREAWKKILLNQFHDIIPGSHTEPVGLEAMQAYRAAREIFETAKGKALEKLAPKSNSNSAAVVNPFSWSRSGIAILDIPASAAGAQAQAQTLPGGGERTAIAITEVPQMGIADINLGSRLPETPIQLEALPNRLENRFFRITLDNQGRCVSIFDKIRDREVVSEGTVANQWQMFQDKPGQFNAWDLHERYPDHPIPVDECSTVEVVENGPLSAAVLLRRSFSKSKAEQVIRIYRDIPRIDFETWVDWHEDERILKVAFPVTVRSRIFTTDTSAGVLERDNHRSTSWQQAKFEVCCHKWIDISEGLFGVSLLNDCKYGCDVQDNVLRLSLLRSPISPDPESDRGEHRFTYSIMTHDGDWRRGGVVEWAYDLNWPMRALAGRKSAAAPALLLDQKAMQVMAFKADEDGGSDLIVRLGELYGSHCTARVTPGFAFSKVFECDLLERTTAELEHDDTSVLVPFRSYQIRTLRFYGVKMIAGS